VSKVALIGQRIGRGAGVRRNGCWTNAEKTDRKPMTTDAVVTYRAGHCALCESMLLRGEDVQSVDMHVFGPVGTVTLRCWLCHACRPTAATVQATSASLADCVLGWYRTNPSVWPALHSATNG
jgi:hypothetical protein